MIVRLEIWMKRLRYIDIAKGMAILCMVLGHTYSMQEKPFIFIWIYSFHMPLFFITSGILYRIKRSGEQKYSSLIQKKTKTLLIPYLIWNTIYQIFISILNFRGGKNIWLTNLQHIIYFNGSAMWFLPVMFIASLIFLVTIKNKYLNIILGITLAIVGINMPECSYMLEVVFRAFVGVIFIEIGYYFYDMYINNFSKIILVIVIGLDILGVQKNGLVNLSDRLFNNPYIYIWTACLGTYIIYKLSIYLDKRNIRLLEYWGKNSIKILCLHGFIIEIIRLVDYKIFGNVLVCMGRWEGVVFTSIIMIILTSSMPLINKFLWWSFGERRENLRKIKQTEKI